MRSNTMILSALTLAAHAHAHEADIGFRVENSILTNWAADHKKGVYTKPERVFEGEFALFSGVVSSDEPGYFFLPNYELSNTRVGFNIRRAVRGWDIINQDFNAISPATITIGNAVLGTVTTPPTDPPSPIPGLSILVPQGGVDFHYPYTLNAAEHGIYLLELEGWTDRPGTGNSEAYWIVLNYGLDPSEHEASVEWVHQNLVPSPGSLALLAGLGIVAARRRRC